MIETTNRFEKLATISKHEGQNLSELDMQESDNYNANFPVTRKMKKLKFAKMETERKEMHSENIADLYATKDVKFLQKPPVVFYPDKLKGGGRPAKIQLPKLRIVRYEENQHLELLANIIRPLFPYWHMFDSHDVCKYNQENNCYFCAVRGLSVRMNDIRQEPYITSHELITKSIDT